MEVEEGNEGSDLIIKLIGRSSCTFIGRTGKHGRGADAHTKEFTKQHILVEHQKVEPSPQAGSHQTSFSFALPPKAPSSLEAQFGEGPVVVVVVVVAAAVIVIVALVVVVVVIVIVVAVDPRNLLLKLG